MSSTKAVRTIGLVTIIAGILLVLGGATTWAVVRGQLLAENIVIPEDAMAFQGEVVDGPLDAFVQADIINTHALKATGGKTYAELERDDPTREVVMNGSFLRTSLFSSVIAFGVAAFAAGMGVLFALVGLALRKAVPAGAAVVPAAATKQPELANA